MSEMTVLVEAADLMEAMNRKAEETPQRLSDLVADVSERIRNNVVDEAPFKTGNLRNAQTVEDITEFSARVYPDLQAAFYAMFFLTGALVTPTEKKALHWEDADGKHFAKSVQFPHIDFYELGFKDSEAEIEEAINNFKQWIIS